MLWLLIVIVLHCSTVNGDQILNDREHNQAINRLNNPRKKHYVHRLNNLSNRLDLASVCEERGFKYGAELGVQKGFFSKDMLSIWKSAERYYMVDPWHHQDGYHDAANYDNYTQESFFQQTKANTAEWMTKTIFMRNYSTSAAPLIPDLSLDFIYIDARHDYCGVKEDILMWWPKLKKGGIMAGHDYMSGYQQLKERVKVGAGYSAKDDWTICADGTIHEGSVKAAVDEMAKVFEKRVFVTNCISYPSFVYEPK